MCIERNFEQYIPSLVGSMFFTSVSVFFSFVLSKVVTSVMSGLSDMLAETLNKTRKSPILISPQMKTSSIH